MLATGLLAGAFGYGAANVIPTFGAVALDVRLTFHTTMMTMNEPVMQSAMALAILATFGLAIAGRGLTRRLALGAGALALASLLITVFGNIPLHAHFRKWATGPVPDGYAEIFQRWELYHTLRTFTALAAFILIVTVAVVAGPSARRAAPAQGGAVMT
ncbi:anthrone oxygenase family protein [Nonomuraea typhae]|uniref:Anthrone oxygenase family protein n=1 Tax=Nonomuraea typhae TaxID=2603600 RepID=A0ABW7Z4G1_9ACTN